LFEVDEAVNKIRAEVDPEAELIFGAIEDQNLNGKMRVSIVATSLDGQEPETKPIVSIVHRLHNRNNGYNENLTNAISTNHATIQATEGATVLNLDNIVEKNTNVQQESKSEEIKETLNDSSLENISIENATYLQNLSNGTESQPNDDIPNFEVDSIELATPELFSNDLENNLLNQENKDQEKTKIFENSNVEKKEELKELEMFGESNLEEDFEIPAFLRRQKN